MSIWPFKKPFEKAPVIDEIAGTINGYAVKPEDHVYAVHVANLPKERVYHATMSTIENWRIVLKNIESLGSPVVYGTAMSVGAVGQIALASPLAPAGKPTDE